MASITVRNLDDPLKEQLRVQAAHNGHSMEEEVRSILRRVLLQPVPARGLGSRIRARFAASGGVDLELPVRDETARAVTIEE